MIVHGKISTAQAANSSNTSAPVWYTCPITASRTPVSTDAAISSICPNTRSRPTSSAPPTAIASATSITANFAMSERSFQL